MHYFIRETATNCSEQSSIVYIYYKKRRTNRCHLGIADLKYKAYFLQGYMYT